MSLAGALPSWFDDAPCRGRTSVFFPERLGSGVYDEAKTYCETCAYRTPCLDWALKHEGDTNKDGRSGMYGGLTPRERAKLRRPQVCEICDAEFHYHRKTPTCSKRCWLVREARYQRAWGQRNRSSGIPHRAHGSNAMANSGCPCQVCRNHRRARTREERVRKSMRERGSAA